MRRRRARGATIFSVGPGSAFGNASADGRSLGGGWFSLVLGCAAILATLSGAFVDAHELGTTRVSVLLDEDRKYQIEVVTDATSLVEKLLASSGDVSSPSMDPTNLQAQLQTFDGMFRQRLVVSFDGLTVHPGIE